jgi:hypothetical protein
VSFKTDDAAILSYGKEENAERREKDRKDINILGWDEYKYSIS